MSSGEHGENLGHFIKSRACSYLNLNVSVMFRVTPDNIVDAYLYLLYMTIRLSRYSLILPIRNLQSRGINNILLIYRGKLAKLVFKLRSS